MKGVLLRTQVVNLPLSLMNPCDGPVEYTWAAQGPHGSTCAHVTVCPPHGTVLPGETLQAIATVVGKAAGEIDTWLTCHISHGNDVAIPIAGSVEGKIETCL
jgi:hypothetical protein